MIKILVAEDEALERKFLEKILRSSLGEEVEVHSVENGLRAVELAGLWHPDIALLDIRMPGLSGLEAAEQIRGILPQCKIAFITAYGEFAYAQQAIRLNVSDYILKPEEDQALINTVNRMIRLVLEEQELAAFFAVPRLAGSLEDGKPEQREIMERVDDYLCANYFLDVSLEAVAEIVGTSASHFSKLFKQYFNQTFLERLTSIRVEQAKKLLLTTNKSTREIGEAVGYPAITYFNAKFKKEVGLPPAEFRRISAEKPDCTEPK